MAYLYVDSKRVLGIRRLKSATFASSGILDSIHIGSGYSARTSKILAYRRRYRDYHNSYLGTVFINLEKLYPCAKNVSFGPICNLVSVEEDGFNRGRALLQASDSGNNFKIFHSTKKIRTFAFTFTGCRQLNGLGGCLPTWYEKILACYLPPSCS